MVYQQQHAESSSTLAAMCHQESTSYKINEYLHCRVCASESLEESMTAEDVTVCINNRSKMAQWCMTLMDACQLNRETVSIAMSYLDRFLATPHGMDCIEDSATFQLACMTALYSAIKIHEEKAISPEVLSTISRGFYTKADMEAMEWKMLNAIQWRVNVPTPLAFVREYLSMIPDLDDNTKDQLLSVATIQTELAVMEYNFCTVKPSSIGFAALTNAMDVMGLESFRLVNYYVLSTDLIDTVEVQQIQPSLYSAVANMSVMHASPRPVTPPSSATSRPKRRQSHTISPRAVTEAHC